MFNGLAVKLLGMIAVGGGDQEDTAATETTNRLDVVADLGGKSVGHMIENQVEDDEDEWVLLNEMDDDSGSAACDLELVLMAPSSAATNDKLMPPPCFLASVAGNRRHYRGRNKYKHVKHLNPNKAKNNGFQSSSSFRQESRCKGNASERLADIMDDSLFSNLLIEHPSLSVYQRGPNAVPTIINDVMQVRVLGGNAENRRALGRPTKTVTTTTTTANNNSNGKNNNHQWGSHGQPQTTKSTVSKENREPSIGGGDTVVGSGRAVSKVNPCYVITNYGMCSPAAVMPASGERLKIQPPAATVPCRSAATITGRRAKRQHFTIYDVSLLSTKGNTGGRRQRKVK